MNAQIKIKKVGNHWYPCIKHELNYLVGFEEKIERYLNKVDFTNNEELTIEFEELGIEWGGINIIYFDESDITRYLMTNDMFDLKFYVNEHLFHIHSDLYFMLEDNYNFNFHKSSYKIHIY